jgi:REP element-mobilizing transposase RayT
MARLRDGSTRNGTIVTPSGCAGSITRCPVPVSSRSARIVGVTFFREIVNGRIRVNDIGMAAQTVWGAIPAHFPGVRLDAFVVMPNHVRGVIVITPTATPPTTRGSEPGRPAGPSSCSVGAIVGSYKSAVSRRVNRMGDASSTPTGPVWQRNYHEVIVRDDDALRRIRAYIEANPRNSNRARGR